MAWSGSFQTTKCKNLSLLISLSEQSQSIENNTTTIAWKISGYRTDGATGYITCGGFKLVINGTTVYSKSEDYRIDVYNGTVVASGTTTISHNSDGTKSFSASAEAGIYYHDVNCSGSGTFTLPTIPRKSSLKVAGGTLGSAVTLNVTRQSNNFTHSIKAVCVNSTLYIKADGSTSTTEVKHSGTSISFKPPINWAQQNTTGDSVAVTFTITTYNGNTNIGSAYSSPSRVTYTIPDSVKPSCQLEITDPTGNKDKYGGYLKGLSKFKVVIKPTLGQGSPIQTYRTTINGQIYPASSFTTDVLTTSGTVAINTTITDKRGRSGTASENPTVLEYSKPSITALSVHRSNEDGTPNDVNGKSIKVVFSSSVTSLSRQNHARYKLEYKKTTETAYTSVALPYDDNYAVNNAVYIIKDADNGSSYNVRVIVTDNFDSGSKTTTASTGFTIMNWLASGLGMAIGKVAELTNVLDIGFMTRFMGGILHPVLEPNTDLNDVRTPNTYVGANISTHKYLNCPLTSGTFSLEVIGMGEEGQVKQRLTYCHKTQAKAWERIYYASAWGEWVCVSDFDGQLLWEGVYYMSGSQTATLTEPVSKQKNGIVLVFSRYISGAAQDYHFQTFFVPKYQVAKHAGCGHTFMMTTDGSFGNFGAKYVYLHDTHITGNNINEAVGTGECGIKYQNNAFVLRYVIGV